MITIRSLAAMGTSLLLALSAGSVFAIPYTPVLDEFWIMKGSAAAGPTEIFRDSFNDTVLPPSGPDGPTTYTVYGPGGITSEANGKLTMTPSLGNPTVITATHADVTTAAIRNLATSNPLNPNFLGIGSSFSIHGLFDMSSLPMIPGQSFGIHASDRAVNLGNLGNNTFSLFVGVSSVTGEVGVFLRLNDYALDTSVVLWTQSIVSSLAGADQIELILSKALGSDEISAAYFLYDYDLSTPVVRAGSIANAGTIYDGEDYIRAQFVTTDRIPIPEPTSLALFGLGVAAIYLVRRRRVIT